MLLWPACSPDLSPIDHKAYGMSWITRSMVCPGSPGLWYVLDHQAYCMSWITRPMVCPGSPGLWYVLDHQAYGMSWITRSMVCPGSPGLWYVLDHQAYGMSWITRPMVCPGPPGLWYVLDHQAYGMSWITRPMVCPGSPGLWYVLDHQAYSMSWITRPIVCPGSSCSTTSTPSSQPKRTDLDPPKKMTTYPTWPHQTTDIFYGSESCCMYRVKGWPYRLSVWTVIELKWFPVCSTCYPRSWTFDFCASHQSG